jgi:hypothetical protein
MRSFPAIALLSLALAGSGCGGPYHTFVTFATVDADPAWAPDGRQLAVWVPRLAPPRLRGAARPGRDARRAPTLSIVDVAGGDSRVLTYRSSTWDDPAWRDGIVGKSTW